MRLFDERQQQKYRLEDEMFEEAFQKLAGVVVGEEAGGAPENTSLRLLSAMEALGRGLNISIPYTPNAELTEEWYQEQYFRPQGVMWRPVQLKGAWYEDAVGVMLAKLKDGSPVALLPAWNRGCVYTDPDTGRRVRVSARLADRFRPEATLYYRPLPLRKLCARDIRAYIRASVSPAEMLALLAATLTVLLLGMVTPTMTKLLTSKVTQFGDLHLLSVILLVLLLVL